MEVVNNQPPSHSDSGSGLGFFLGAVLLIIFAFLLFYYGVPALKNNLAPAVPTPPTQNQPAPPSTPSDSQDTNIYIPIPDDINVNVDGEKMQ